MYFVCHSGCFICSKSCSVPCSAYFDCWCLIPIFFLRRLPFCLLHLFPILLHTLLCLFCLQLYLFSVLFCVIWLPFDIYLFCILFCVFWLLYLAVPPVLHIVLCALCFGCPSACCNCPAHCSTYFYYQSA